jgi:hypothetical protein
LTDTVCAPPCIQWCVVASEVKDLNQASVIYTS